MIAGFDACDAWADRLDDARAFVPGDARHRMLGRAGDEMPIAVTDAAGGDAHEDFARARRIERERFDGERLLGTRQERGLNIHG